MWIWYNGYKVSLKRKALAVKGGIKEGTNPPVYNALARHAVAALLNSAHPHVEYTLSQNSIIDVVSDAIVNIDLTDAEPLKNMLDKYNNLGGGIEAQWNPL